MVEAKGRGRLHCRRQQRRTSRPTRVALVTAEPRLVMRWKGRVVMRYRARILNSNGAETSTRAVLAAPQLGPVQVAGARLPAKKCTALWPAWNVCSQRA